MSVIARTASKAFTYRISPSALAILKKTDADLLTLPLKSRLQIKI